MSFENLELLISNYPGKIKHGKGSSNEEIDDCAHRLNITISGDFRKFLKKFGWIDVAYIETFGLGEDVEPPFDLCRITISERNDWPGGFPLHLLPVYNDGAGNLFCVDTLIQPEPRVVFMSHEEPSEKPEIAGDSFSNWLSTMISEAAE